MEENPNQDEIQDEFDYEFFTKILDPDDQMKKYAESELRNLAEGQKDMIGARVSIEELSKDTTPNRYRANIVAWVRPENINAEEKAEFPMQALKGALKAVERQVREKRDRLGGPWKQP
jgi:ribosome-associated translation inhibitor RaiA